jgi:uncharacterized integral membrane protein
VASGDSSTTERRRPGTDPERRTRARVVAAVILGGLLVLFAVLNSQTVKVHLVATTLHWPLIVVIAGCVLIGFAIGWLVFRRRAARGAAPGPSN